MHIYILCTGIGVNKVVRLLSTDPRLVSNWKELARQLKIPNAEINEISKNRSREEVLHGVLQFWISRCGNSATIKELIISLRREYFGWAACK